LAITAALVSLLARKQSFLSLSSRRHQRVFSARNGDCNNSVIALRSKPFKGSFSGLPYDFLRIICTDDGKESLELV